MNTIKSASVYSQQTKHKQHSKIQSLSLVAAEIVV